MHVFLLGLAHSVLSSSHWSKLVPVKVKRVLSLDNETSSDRLEKSIFEKDGVVIIRSVGCNQCATVGDFTN